MVPRFVRILAAAGLLAASGSGLTASAASAGMRAGLTGSVSSLTVNGLSNAVAAASASDAWAVGENQAGVLIAEWNGQAWKIVPGPKRLPKAILNGVAVLSPRDAWAVGVTNLYQTLILHWNGKSWSRVPSPNVRGEDELYGVAATSAGNAWAVGAARTGEFTDTSIIEHWNGRAWEIVPDPKHLGTAILYGVTAPSESDAWTVGDVANSSALDTLTEHWNGHAWTLVPSPSASPALLFGVAYAAPRSPWAVGDNASKNLIERWTGSNWKEVPSPDPGAVADGLDGVAALSSSDAWAVGYSIAVQLGSTKIVILHWNGTAWATTAAPSPGPNASTLTGVAAVSSRGAWAVGYTYVTNVTASYKTLILRWNGSKWT